MHHLDADQQIEIDYAQVMCSRPSRSLTNNSAYEGTHLEEKGVLPVIHHVLVPTDGSENAERNEVSMDGPVSMAVEYKDQVKSMVLDEQVFVRLTMKGQARDAIMPWRQVIVRPVLIKNERFLQFSYFNQKQDITKNYRGSQASQKLDELLALSFNSIVVQSTTEDLRVQITNKGKAILHRAKATAANREPQ